MTDNWRMGTPAQLVAELRVGGWVVGRTGKLPQALRLHKTDLIADIRALPDNHQLTWRIHGDPNATGRHDAKRRTIVLWLGQ